MNKSQDYQFTSGNEQIGFVLRGTQGTVGIIWKAPAIQFRDQFCVPITTPQICFKNLLLKTPILLKLQRSPNKQKRGDGVVEACIAAIHSTNPPLVPPLLSHNKGESSRRLVLQLQLIIAKRRRKKKN